MKGRKKWFIAGGAALVLALIAVSVLTSRESGTKVEVETAERRDLTATVTASGTVEPQSSVNISATTSGEVVRIGVDEGQRVQEGDFLLQLDPVNVAASASGQAAAVQAARADLAAAEAQLAYARQEYERMRELAQAELVPRAELEAAEAELRSREAGVRAAQGRVQQAGATLTSARHDVSRVTFNSPIDGVVTKINVEEGEVALLGTMNQPGTILMTVADLGVMEATIDVDETDVVAVKIGQPATVTIDAFPDTTFAGQVTEVGTSPAIVPTATGPSGEATDFEVVITIDGALPDARSGLSCSADIKTAERESVLTIPIQSLVVRSVSDDTTAEGVTEKEGVFVVRDGTAHFVPVHIGITGERHFEVRSGLEEGDQVVSGSYQALRDLADGDTVEIEEEEEDDSEAEAS
ncbi:MAG: efflux RND transporter periplasmic adaptor subunit [Gemmatimonadota bacterium]